MKEKPQRDIGQLHKKERPASIGKSNNQRETAQYTADMVLELRSLARGANLTALSELLELAFYEAFSMANKVDASPAEIKRIKAMEKAAADEAR